MAAHLALLAVIVFHNPKVIDLSPAWLAYGDGTHTYQLVYLPPGNDDAEAAKLLFPPRASKPRPRRSVPPKPAPEPEHVETIADAEAGDHNSHAGSPLGYHD